MDYFKLTRAFWDYAFENPEKIKPNHCALYLFIVEHCNRLGWKKKFGLPTTMAKDAIGIRSYNTYIITLNDLVEFGLIELIEKSKNQYSSNIVAISNFDKAVDKALDKAFINHATKQSESTSESIDSIDKQDTNIQINKYTKNKEFLTELLDSQSWLESVTMNNQKKFTLIQVKEKLNTFAIDLDLKFDIKQNKTEFASHFISWLNKQENTKVKPFFNSPA
ncbi:MAG: hypothetical protein RLZZ605_1407 [Bacteroidota bacterium]|jgi:hypothetical protein